MFKKTAIALILACFIIPSQANAQNKSAVQQTATTFNYEQCIQRARKIGVDEEAKCIHNQMLIELKNLQLLYDGIANDPTQKVISKTDAKKMYDNWFGYRNTYCEAYARVVEEQTYFFNKEKCLLEHTKNAYLYMKAIADLAHRDAE